MSIHDHSSRSSLRTALHNIRYQTITQHTTPLQSIHSARSRRAVVLQRPICSSPLSSPETSTHSTLSFAYSSSPSPCPANPSPPRPIASHAPTHAPQPLSAHPDSAQRPSRDQTAAPGRLNRLAGGEPGLLKKDCSVLHTARASALIPLAAARAQAQAQAQAHRHGQLW